MMKKLIFTILVTLLFVSCENDGHNMHYWDTRGGIYARNFHNTLGMLRESFGDYVGWYLGEKYYVGYGWEKPSGLLTTGMIQPSSSDVDITGCADQAWIETTPPEEGWYSPLFIDLTDAINQNAYFTNSRYYQAETIQGVPPSVVWNIISTCTTWGQVRTKMEQTLVPRYCTSTQLDDYLEEYNYWFLIYTGSISR